MKKLVSLIMALALVLGLATVAFATEGATVVEDITAWNAYEVGTTYQWTATEAGILELQSYGAVQFNLSVSNEAAYAYFYGDFGGVMNLTAGDVVTIEVVALPESESTSDYMWGSFYALGSINNPYAPDWTWDGLSYETAVIAPNEGVFFSFNGVEGSTMVIESAEVMVEINEKYYVPANGALSYEFELGGMGPKAGTSGTLIQIINTGAEAQSFKIAFNYPLGSYKNPEVVTEFNTVLKDATVGSGWYGSYYYSFTAPTDGTLTFSIDDADWAAKDWDVIEMTNYDSMSYVSYMGMTCVTKQMVKGEEIIIFTAAPVEDPMPVVPVAFSFVGPEGTISNPIVISAAGDYQVAGDEVWYAVNSMLAGYVVAVQGDNAYLKVGDNVINAVDGVATAVLNGNGPVIPVVVGNATDMIILPAPTEINAAGDYTANVAAGAEVEYAINSKLSGAVLTVNGEGAYILIGTTKYEAVDGVASAVLDAQGATIAVKIGNAGTAAADYALNIAYPPVEINAVGDFTANVGAGAEVLYAVNSKLAGATLTVKGEGAYIMMGDKKIEAVNDVASVVLDGKGAVIAVSIGNAGNAAAAYEASISYPASNPNTGDMTLIASAAMMALSAIGGVALVAKKKEF